MDTLRLEVPPKTTVDMFIFGGLRNSSFDVESLCHIEGGKQTRRIPRIRSLIFIHVTLPHHQDFAIHAQFKTSHKNRNCPGLELYEDLYEDRLVYDTMQNPDKRARMATKQGFLQTLTTGVSGLWSKTFSRFIRLVLRTEVDVFAISINM